LQDTPKVPKLAFVKLAFSAILELLRMTTWDVGSISFNVYGKVECDEDLTIVIRTILVGYVKTLKMLGWGEIICLHLIK
jgi:hypothetical protein